MKNSSLPPPPAPRLSQLPPPPMPSRTGLPQAKTLPETPISRLLGEGDVEGEASSEPHH